MTSVSLDAWKMEPRRSSSSRSSAALVMLPLCATATRPLLQRDGEGLGVEQHRVAGGGVAGVADGQLAGQGRRARAG